MASATSLPEGGLRYLLANHPIRLPLSTARKKAVCGADGLGGCYGVNLTRARALCAKFAGGTGVRELSPDSLAFLRSVARYIPPRFRCLRGWCFAVARDARGEVLRALLAK